MAEACILGSYRNLQTHRQRFERKTGESYAPIHQSQASDGSHQEFAWKGEQAFRHEVLVLVVLAALLAVTGKDAGQWLLVLGGWIGVMVVELLNSADEESFDLVTTEWNEHVKRGKDMASAAIFLAMVINAGIWVYTFFLS